MVSGRRLVSMREHVALDIHEVPTGHESVRRVVRGNGNIAMPG